MSEQRQSHRDTQDQPTPPREGMVGDLVPYEHSPVSSANDDFQAAASALDISRNFSTLSDDPITIKSDEPGLGKTILPLLSGKVLNCSDPATFEALRDCFDGIPVIKSDDPDFWLKLIPPPTPGQCKSDITTAFAEPPPSNIFPSGLLSGWSDDPPPTDSGDSSRGE